MSTKTPLISLETLKTIGQGALGAMTFGVYNQYNSNKIMELNNEKIKMEHHQMMDKMQLQHEREKQQQHEEMMVLRNKIELLEKQKHWW